jgi:hypothetical protein
VQRPWLRKKGEEVQVDPSWRPRPAKAKQTEVDPETRRHELRTLFEFLDTTGSGSLGPEQLEQLLTIVGPGALGQALGGGHNAHVDALQTLQGAPAVSFETFWGWYQGTLQR